MPEKNFCTIWSKKLLADTSMGGKTSFLARTEECPQYVCLWIEKQRHKETNKQKPIAHQI